MSDVDPEKYSESTTENEPASAAGQHRAQEHPVQEAHGGSMAPGQVDDTGHRTSEPLPGELG
ncbi:hypothetical protein Acy02nite_51110 [Actinoplanes cyaneus]|uniref:Uncharacterized protein n=1 Tax=Actinoplanes cyaneus TaxID=52696 RepID=A0A919IJK1_9ACTN|nr:hypothetical protein [Actinoplanes cyaneus]MCW2141167.1 hypothetical protein [Actinoplanes cyaneus]GID67230.1 hypothetical protein Acy02nite_51110 [Actinoplanes cyaneus]